MRRKKDYDDKEHFCNRGDIRICQVCQYNNDCPFKDE